MTQVSWIRQVLLALALLGLGVRAFAPPGYMFAQSPSGLAITLCGGETMHVDFGKHAPAQRNSDNGPCLFAAAAHAAQAPIAAAAPAPIVMAAIDAPSAPANVRIGQGLAAPPPPSTGPPQLA